MNIVIKDECFYNLENVFYPIGGMANICEKITDLFQRGRNYDRIEIVISSQLNSYPHIGTIVNFMATFSLAKKISEELKKEVSVNFDYLENVCAETVEYEGIPYFISLADKKEANKSIADKNMVFFEDLLKRLSKLSGIKYITRSYAEYQANPVFRKLLIKIIENYDELAELLNPSEKKLHIRTVCPICKYGEKTTKLQKIQKISNKEYCILSKCMIHGEYNIFLKENNKDYIDINCQLRDLMKGAYLLERQQEGVYGIMVDGGDWGGLWPLRVFAEGLMKLGYKELPGRIFTPTITDWAGTKLSKRLYVGDNAFRQFQEGIMNYEQFFVDFGESGFNKLWEEINEWMDRPARFFRDYSVDYLRLILGKI